MFNFPSYLEMYWTVNVQPINPNPSVKTSIIEIIADLNNIYNQGSKRLRYIPTIWVTDGYTKESQQILNKISKNKDLQKISIWVYNHIILKVFSDTQLTISVKIRIASNMLRIALNNDNLYRYCADSLIYNVKSLTNEILNEQLPF